MRFEEEDEIDDWKTREMRLYEAEEQLKDRRFRLDKGEV